MEQGITKQQIIAELTRSAHGELPKYLPIAQRAAKEEPEFLAHLIAWNQEHGAIRDSKVALPVSSLSVPAFADPQLVQNSLAHLALLSPREILRAVSFSRLAGSAGHGRSIRRLIEQYLRAREADRGWWTQTAIQHRAPMKSLYALAHVKPAPFADQMLMKGVNRTGVFKLVGELKDMPAAEAAAAIMEKRIPFVVALPALGAKAKDPDLALALITRMSATELVTNTKTLERLGVKQNPVLRAAFEAGLEKVATSKRQVLKTTRAAQAVDDPTLKAKLLAAQEKQLSNLEVDGDWLVLGDKSSSMQDAIESAKLVAATLARMVRGRVVLCFFDSSPTVFDVTGKSYEQVVEATRHVRANGSTSIGCGLDWALKGGHEFSGIAVVSDGAENTSPRFAATLAAYQKKFDREVPAYLYWMKCYSPSVAGNNPGTMKTSMEAAGLALDVFDLRQGVDYHSLPNVVATMRANRYSLVDAIMATPLLTVAQALKLGN